jgi:hypothetical protein
MQYLRDRLDDGGKVATRPEIDDDIQVWQVHLTDGLAQPDVLRCTL